MTIIGGTRCLNDFKNEKAEGFEFFKRKSVYFVFRC